VRENIDGDDYLEIFVQRVLPWFLGALLLLLLVGLFVLLTDPDQACIIGQDGLEYCR